MSSELVEVSGHLDKYSTVRATYSLYEEGAGNEPWTYAGWIVCECDVENPSPTYVYPLLYGIVIRYSPFSGLTYTSAHTVLQHIQGEVVDFESV